MKKRKLIKWAILLFILLSGGATTAVLLSSTDAPTFDEISDQTIAVGTEDIDWTTYMENVLGSDVTLNETEDLVSYDVLGTYTVTVTATDAKGNVTSQTFNVTVVDDVTPTLSLNGDASITVEAGATYNDLGATFLDNYDGTGQATVGGDTVNTAVVGVYEVVYTYSDTSGNDATPITRTVTVVDTTAPTLTLLGDQFTTIQAGIVYEDLGASFSDIVDGTGTVTATGTVDVTTLGTYTLTYTYTDAAGNVGQSVTRTVTVVDTTAPTIELTSGNAIQVELGTTFTDPGYSATDNYDESVDVTVTGTVDSETAGVYTLTYTSTDHSDNEATVTRTVTVSDTTAPTISMVGESEITLEYGSTYTEQGATFADGQTAGNATVGGDTVDTNTLGTYVVTYTATDAAGNETVVTKTVHVVDTTAPVITLNSGSSMTIQLSETFTDPGYTVTDNADSNVSVTVSGNVDTNTLGEYTLTYTATDASGNTSTVTRTITVSDAPARLAQFAVDGETFSVRSYAKLDNGNEIFRLSFDSKLILVIFDGNDVVFQQTFLPDGPFFNPSQVAEDGPTQMLNSLFVFSNDYLFLSLYDMSLNTQVLYALQLTDYTLVELPVGNFVGFSSSETGMLYDNQNYLFYIISGTDKGIYQFDSDLNLVLLQPLLNDYMWSGGYNTIIPNELYLITFSSSNIEEKFTFDLVNNTVELVSNVSLDANNLRVGDSVSYRIIGDYILETTTIYTTNDSNGSWVYTDTTYTSVLFDQSLNELATYNSYADYMYTDSTNQTMSYFYFTEYSETGITITLYDADVNLINTYELGLQSSFYFTDDFRLVVFNQNTAQSEAMKLDGSVDTFELPRTINQMNFSINHDYTSNISIGLYFDAETLTVINAIYTADGWISFETDQNYTSIVYNNLTNQVFVTRATWNYDLNQTSIAYEIYDIATETLHYVDAVTYDFISNYTSAALLVGTYTLLQVPSNNSSQVNTFVLFDDQFNYESLDVSSYYIYTYYGYSKSMDGNTAIFENYSLSFSFDVTDFTNTFTTFTSSGGNGGTQTIVKDSILNGIDLNIVITHEDMSPTTSYEFTYGDVTFNETIDFADFSLLVYDVAGTENDTIYIFNSFAGYIMDINDDTHTKIYGIITTSGFLMIDSQYVEYFDYLSANDYTLVPIFNYMMPY